MVFRHGRRTGVAIGGNDLTTYFNSADSTAEIETPDVTTFGDVDARSYIVGKRDGSASLSGFFDGAADAVDAVLHPLLADEDAAAVFIQQGFSPTDGVGLRATFGVANVTNYGLTTPIDGVVAISVDLEADRGLYNGVTLHDPDATGLGFDDVAAGASTDVASADGGASTADGYAIHLQVVSNDLDGDLIVSVEDSSDDSTFATLDTFTTVATGVTTVEQIVEQTGTVERYVRINVDTTGATTGSAVIAVAIARLPNTVDQTE